MQPKQTFPRTVLALTLVVSLFTAVAPLARPAEAFSGGAAYAIPDSAVTTSATDPSSVQPGPGSVSPSSVHPGASTSGASQPAATAAPGIPSAGASSMKSGDNFEAETAPNGKRARAGSLIVTFRSGIQASARDDANHQVGAQTVEPIGHTKAVRVQVEPGKLAEAMSAYAERPDVERVEPDYLLYAHMTPNDPRYRDEWGLPRIGAPTAWDRVPGGAGVRVAVLDTGIANHPDLSGRVILAQDFTGSPYGSTDRHGHGTHVAGTVAANANNGVGVVGVAYSASLLNAKVLGDSGSGSFSSVANGIVWAADNGAKVISMSLGANLDCPGVIQDAVSYAWSRGAVIVAAAGNDGMNDAHTPANCANVVPVGAVNSNDGRPAFSNYGPAVPISAPGDVILSTSKDGDYVAMSGTSMSTPHAAGVAALIWASSYGTGNQAVVNRLFSTADRIAGTGNLWVYGRVNAASAVAGSGGGPPPAVPSPSPSPSPTPSPAPLPPVSCTPRPPVRVTTARATAGTLRVTVTAGTASSGTNSLQQIRFGAGANAIVEAGTHAESGSFTVTIPEESVAYTFMVKRNVAGAATTVPLTVVDRCGEWPSLVGGGPTAF